MWSDDGMVFRVSEGEQDIPASVFTPLPDAAEDILMQRLSETHFLGPVSGKMQAVPFCSQEEKTRQAVTLVGTQETAASLLKVASEFRDFPIVLETYRECLVDHFDMNNLKAFWQPFKAVKSGRNTVGCALSLCQQSHVSVCGKLHLRWGRTTGESAVHRPSPLINQN